MTAIGLYDPNGKLVVSVTIEDDALTSDNQVEEFYAYVHEVALMYGGLYTQTELEWGGVSV